MLIIVSISPHLYNGHITRLRLFIAKRVAWFFLSLYFQKTIFVKKWLFIIKIFEVDIHTKFVDIK